jgi:hypothetical protein
MENSKNNQEQTLVQTDSTEQVELKTDIKAGPDVVIES